MGFSSGTRDLLGGGQLDSPVPSDFPPGAEDLVRALLHPDPTQRLGGGGPGNTFSDLAHHPWLAPLGDVHRLHSRVGPPIPPCLLSANASQTASSNGKWLRRHASSLWAPTHAPLKAFDLFQGDTALSATSATTASLPSLRELFLAKSLPPL